MKYLLSVIFAFSLLAACTDQLDRVPDADLSTQRLISSGEIIGFHREDIGVDHWLGIPFAAPPVEDLRWRAPQPHSNWQDAREVLSHGEPCPQVVTAMSAESFGVKAGSIVGSEDCLFLDVYAPHNARAAGPLPVMVWVHGGSNLWGRTADYYGGQLAADQNVIVIMIQYRLGPFGYFAHEDLFRADEGANFAHLDHIAALKWVQNNARVFGGDPNNVTVFGESAGGRNIGVLLASPLAKGLFHKAIIQSGFFSSSTLAEAQSGLPSSAQNIAEALGTQNAQALRTISTDSIFQPYIDGDLLSDMPRVIADGVSIPVTGLKSAFDKADTFNRVPLITGTNRDEMKLFNVFSDELTRRHFGLIITTPDRDLYNAASDYSARVWRLGAVDDMANQMLAAGHSEVWTYRFDWDEGGKALFMDMSHLLGAAHALEIPFVMNHFDVYGWIGPVLFNKKNAPSRERLARQMGYYWAEFARNGNPGEIDDLVWEPWNDKGYLMRFDTQRDNGPEMMAGQESETLILTDLLADDRLSNTLRCRLFKEALVDWRPELIDHPLAQEICSQ